MKSPVCTTMPMGVLMAIPHGVRDRVADTEELDVEPADTKRFVGLDHVEFRAAEHTALAQLHADEAVGQPRCIHRDVQVLEDPWQGADVVFVAVCYQDGPYPGVVVQQVRDVGDGEIDSGGALVGEQHARVHDDDVAAVLDGHHVLADLA